MDDFYRNRSARLSDEIKRVVNETRVSIFFCLFLPKNKANFLGSCLYKHKQILLKKKTICEWPELTMV